MWTVTTAMVVALVCTTAIGTDLLNSRPREVIAVVAGSIDPAPTTVAIADSDVYGMTQADVDKTMDAIRAANVRSVRLLIPWAGVEASQGQLDWSTVDKTVNSAASRQLAVVGVVNSAPTWAVAPGGQYLSGRPASPDTYGDFVAKVAARYQGKIAALEIWNEPNAVMF
ncbi:MAG: polysaccharide biosynthesis protein PslG, partial [Mycobacterium sp.]|nr:polysaccharide biosynthesis protein PslG [Mycobacterium sp.]